MIKAQTRNHLLYVGARQLLSTAEENLSSKCFFLCKKEPGYKDMVINGESAFICWWHNCVSVHVLQSTWCAGPMHSMHKHRW